MRSLSVLKTHGRNFFLPAAIMVWGSIGTNLGIIILIDMALFRRGKGRITSRTEWEDSAFIRCPACGKELHSTIPRCPYCSAFLEIKCPNCDRTTNRALKKCPFCETSLVSVRK